MARVSSKALSDFLPSTPTAEVGALCFKVIRSGQGNYFVVLDDGNDELQSVTYLL